MTKKWKENKPSFTPKSTVTWVGDISTATVQFLEKHEKEINRIKKRREKTTTAEHIDYLFALSFEKGFKCAYCGHKLQLHSQKPNYYTPSVDHKIPLTRGGTDTIDNLCLCCYLCNICKGVWTAEEWVELINYIPPERFQVLMKAWFRGRHANKMGRTTA